MCAASLRKDAYVDMLYISAGDGKRDEIFGLAGCGAGMTTNASCLIDDLGPLHCPVLWFFKHESFAICAHGRLGPVWDAGESELYHATEQRKHDG
jgi:hypothetical protein